MNGGREADSSPTPTVALWGPLSLADGGEGGGSPREDACACPRCQPPGPLPGHPSHQFSPAPEAGAGAPDSRFSPSQHFSSHAGTRARSRVGSTPATPVLTRRFSKEGKTSLDDAGRVGQGPTSCPRLAREFGDCSKGGPTEGPEGSSPTGPHLISPCSSCTLTKVETIGAVRSRHT